MENKMFCFQCQEACRNTGCTAVGMCGKRAETAHLMDQLVRQLKIAARVLPVTRENGRLMMRSLFMTLTNTNFDDEALRRQLQKLEGLCGPVSDDMRQIPCGVQSSPDEDIVSLRELLTCGLKGIAAYGEHAAVLGYEEDEIYAFVFKALGTLGDEAAGADVLTALVLEAGSAAAAVMALLDQANTSCYGHPEITRVKLGVGNRSGILISGHDLRDLQELLEQSKDSGIDIYTHGEMLPAHCYPELKKYSHLHGNYGNAWYLQSKEFAAFNGPVLMTTNCITPVQDSYRNRIFTTGVAGYPGVPHIPGGKDGQSKDFSALIALAKTCPPPEELEQGELLAGFAHHQVLALADKVVEAVKTGAIKRFIVMAGCDGRQSSRQYYTNVARQLPEGTVILTAGCAKYRYNKLPLGDINGIPRVLDAGQCNDCYSLAVIALKLKEAFELEDVNQLPLSFDIAWYEQKAVAVLLAVLSLGFKNIRLGPTLPAFLSPNVAETLVETFDIKGIATPEEDIANMMQGA